MLAGLFEVFTPEVWYVHEYMNHEQKCQKANRVNGSSNSAFDYILEITFLD